MSQRQVRLAVWAVFLGVGAAPPASAQAIITTLDSGGDVGRSSDVAYGPDGRALVSYLDATNGDLKVAACQDVSCTSALLHTIDDSGTASGSTSIAFAPDGRAVVSYVRGGALSVARCVDPSCTAATRFPIESVNASSAIGVGADGLPIVAYGGSLALKVAHCNDPDCATSTVTTYAGRGNLRPSLAIGGDGRALFAGDNYVSLDVGHCSDVACTSATFTTLVGIAIIPSSAIRYLSASLAVGADGRGVLASAKEAWTIIGPNETFELRRCLDVSCSGLTPVLFSGQGVTPSAGVMPGDLPVIASYGGLPGPEHLQVTRCSAPTCGASATTVNLEPAYVGQQPELAVGPDGVALISYYDSLAGDLKVAYLAEASLSIQNAQVIEGNSGITPLSFPVTLSLPANATVQYSTKAGTATQGVDYLQAQGILTFTPGSLTQAVTVGVVGDLAVEPDEMFAVVLSAPQGAVIEDGTAVGGIRDDDVVPTGIGASLEHGVTYTADLAPDPGPVADVDHYRITQLLLGSWEIVADEVSGDADPLDLRLTLPDGQTTLYTAVPTGTGSSRSLRWRSSFEELNQLVRVSGSCGAACGPDDTYRLRVYETTLRGARFNNAGTQTTVLLLHNTGHEEAGARVLYWSATGESLAAASVQPPLAAKEVRVIPLAGIAGLEGQSGSLTVQHDAPYGVLVGKTVALEPATGFSFDTPLEPRPR